MGDVIAALALRLDFVAPETYRQLVRDGCSDPHHADHLQFTDLEWWQSSHVERWQPDPRQVTGLVPFAQTLSGHLWCWYPDIDPRLPAPVVFCPEEDEVAVLYAPDFGSWLYRVMLEELSGTFLVERVGMQQATSSLLHFADILQRYLPVEWGQRLRELSQGALTERQENFYGVISEEECEAIVHADIAYDRLDEEFEHIHEDTE
jgi:hypothetical protein